MRPVTMPNTTCVAVGSSVFVGGISVAVGATSVAMRASVAGTGVGVDAPQAARIMAIAVTSKVIRNKLWYIIFPFIRFECAPSQRIGFGHYQCSIHLIQKLDIFYQCHLIT